jgi:hypothetical protein
MEKYRSAHKESRLSSYKLAKSTKAQYSDPLLGRLGRSDRHRDAIAQVFQTHQGASPREGSQPRYQLTGSMARNRGCLSMIFTKISGFPRSPRSPCSSHSSSLHHNFQTKWRSKKQNYKNSSKSVNLIGFQWNLLLVSYWLNRILLTLSGQAALWKRSSSPAGVARHLTRWDLPPRFSGSATDWRPSFGNSWGPPTEAKKST